MPMRANPYQADAGQYNAISQGIGNLAQAFMASQPNPVNSARAEQAAWAARKSREEAMDTSLARSGRGRMGGMLEEFDPAGDHRSLWAEAVRSGAVDVNDMPGLHRGLMANFGGDDSQLARAFAGAGDAIGVNDAFSLEGRDQVAQRNLGHNIARDQATPSLDQALGMAFSGGDMSLGEIERQRNPQRFAQAGYYNAQAGQVGVPTSRDATVAHRYATEGPEAANAARLAMYGEGGRGGAGGGADGAGGVDELAATRRATVGEAADEAVNQFAADMGLDAGAIPPDLRGALVDGAVRAVLNDQVADPRAAVAQLWREYGVDADVTGWRNHKRELRYNPDALGGAFAPQGQAAPAQPQGGGRVPSLQMPDGVSVSPEEIEATARGRGMTPEQVIQQLEAAGGQRIPGA